MSRITRIFFIVFAAAALAASASVASAATVSDLPSAEVRIVEGPALFEWNSTLLYRMLLTSKSNTTQTVNLDYWFYNCDKVNEGAAYHRQVTVGPMMARLVDFRVYAALLPMTGSHEQRCFIAFINGEFGEWTHADSVGK